MICRVSSRLISAKNRWILPKNIKESVDLPDFVKESVGQIQILCTFQAEYEASQNQSKPDVIMCEKNVRGLRCKFFRVD